MCFHLMAGQSNASDSRLLNVAFKPQKNKKLLAEAAMKFALHL